MYGKKRVVLNKKNQIIIAGKDPDSSGGNWFPVGVFIKRDDGLVKARFLSPENEFDRKLTDENSIAFEGSLSEVRQEIKRIFEIN
jgi:hypothetical protein